ncbi:MAG TPA: homoserine kinase [Burkholderiales bacterium]
MSVYTTVTPEQLGGWLTQHNAGTLVDLRGISAGIENTNYFVTTSAGRYVLTLFEKLTAAELPFYLGLMAHLADCGIPSARPVPDLDGRLLGELNGKPAALVSFLPGTDIEQPSEAQCAAVGTMLARIHLAGRSYPATIENPRGLSWWQRVAPEMVRFLTEHDAALLQGEVDFQSRQQFAELPRGAIHGDLFRDNALFEGMRISGIIDFYFACTDALLYDVAICVNDWGVSVEGAIDVRRTGALLRAYASTRPFVAQEAQAWPILLRAAALRFWISRLYDFHRPRPGVLTHAKDPRHFQRILEQHIRKAHALPHVAL